MDTAGIVSHAGVVSVGVFASLYCSELVAKAPVNVYGCETSAHCSRFGDYCGA